MASPHHDTTPVWAWLVPVAAAVLLALKVAHVVPADALPTQLLATVLLGGSVFSAVHHAEVLALRLGEPFGSILLAISVTVIELGLIISITLAGGPGSEAVTRDTVFSAAMIVLNGIVGLCLVLGGSRYREQSFQLQGATAALSVLGPLAVLAMILPNYTQSAPGPYYSHFQLLFVGVVSLVLYVIFVFVQTVRHRDYFIDVVENEGEPAHARPPGRVALASAVLLLVSLAAVVLLAKILSAPLDHAVAAAGLPPSFVGVVIAAIVLLPEGLASTRAALADRLQNSLNLALGSAIASIGLTVPAMAFVSLATGHPLALGLADDNVVLLVLTLLMSTLTLGTGRTTVLQGGVHLVIFAVFLMVAATSS